MFSCRILTKSLKKTQQTGINTKKVPLDSFQAGRFFANISRVVRPGVVIIPRKRETERAVDFAVFHVQRWPERVTTAAGI